MTRRQRQAWMQLVVTVAFVACGAVVLIAAAPQDSKPSEFAPSKDLISQIELFIERIGRDLEDETEFSEEQHQSISRNANTLVVLGLVLGLHDEDNSLKPASASLMDAATQLAENAEDFKAAQEALEEVKQSLKKKSDKKLEWEGGIADMDQLMKQVPIVNTLLRRGVNGRRFKRSIDVSAGYSATLAAIAQASLFDTAYCADEEDEAKWAKLCADMRDAAAEVNRAVRNEDQNAAKRGLFKLETTCDRCHKDFR